jgi:hypothetical protein
MLGIDVRGGDKLGSFGIAGTIPTTPEDGAAAGTCDTFDVEAGNMVLELSVPVVTTEVVAISEIGVVCCED